MLIILAVYANSLTLEPWYKAAVLKATNVKVAQAVPARREVVDTPWLKLEQVRTLQMEKPSGPGRLPHVSAASGLVKVGSTLWVAADDENQLAAFDGRKKGRWVPVLPGVLPGEKEARREVKPDFEALAQLPAFAGAPNGGLFTLTSGSAPNRTKAAFVPLDGSGAAGAPKVLELGVVLQALSKRIDQLNIEGAVVSGDTLKLLHRGGENGGNAIIDLDLAGLSQAIASGAAPGAELIRDVKTVDLGSLAGVPLGFSDASPLPDGSLVFTASAEDTDDPKLDGAVTGSIIGVLSPDGQVRARFPVKDLKLEGVHAEVKGKDVHVTLVSDADDEKVPSPMHRAVLKGLAPQKAQRLDVKTGFELGGAPAKAVEPGSFTETAKTSRSTGWDTAVSTGAAASVRKSQAELKHFAKLADAGGLKPDQIRVGHFEPGQPESQWLSVKGDDGTSKVVWQLRNATGQVPEPLQRLAGELGVTDVATGEVEGAAPIPAVTDVSPKAAFGRAMKLADQLATAAGVDPKKPELQLFRYTVARYMLNATTPQSLAYLADNYKGDTKGLLATGQVPARWVEKLERGFKKPYTNDESLVWLRQMAAKLTEAVQYVDEVNTKGSPITFYTAGSTTKARWSVGSDLDVLIDSPDKDLEQKILKGPHGFYGGANKEEFAILNASFYWERTHFFGTPVELAKGTAAMKPELVEEVFKRTSAQDWGVRYEGSHVDITPAAAEKFVREAPSVTEVLYDFSRPTRGQLDTKWVTEHWANVVRDAPEIRLYSRQRLVDEGTALVKALLPAALSPANIARFFEAQGLPVPDAGADVAKLIPPMKMDEFLGLTDTAEKLFVDFASSEQVKAAAEGTIPSPWADAFSAVAAS